MSDGNASLRALPGHLYVVATPLGNLADITTRARGILESCDLVACEDKRTTGVLLNHLGLRKELVAYHEHNELAQAEPLADRLAGGQSIALVSDAGTPAVSDPGFRLVRECRRRGLPVVPVPGPSAVIALLSASGLPTNGFFYAGFLPPKSAARKTFLEKYRDFPFTVAVYESCHRIMKFLDDIVSVLGDDRVISVGKELTKLHEAIVSGPAGHVREQMAGMSQKGEFSVLIAPPDYIL